MAKHIHRYEKRVLGKKGYTVFMCNLPDCRHYIEESLAKGKRTICNRCGNEMILDARAIKLVKPHCANCIEVKKGDTHERLLEYLKENTEAADSNQSQDMESQSLHDVLRKE